MLFQDNILVEIYQDIQSWNTGNFYSFIDIHFLNVIFCREHGQGTQDEVRSRDFRRELEEREKDKRLGGSRTEHGSNKRLKLDQVPAASLDADDPVDAEEDSDSSGDEDDTEALLAELNKIKKERALGLFWKILSML